MTYCNPDFGCDCEERTAQLEKALGLLYNYTRRLEHATAAQFAVRSYMVPPEGGVEAGTLTRKVLGLEIGEWYGE